MSITETSVTSLSPAGSNQHAENFPSPRKMSSKSFDPTDRIMIIPASSSNSRRKTYVCQQCDYRTSKRFNAMRHAQRCNRMYKCPLCSCPPFSSPLEYASHVKAKHKKKTVRLPGAPQERTSAEATRVRSESVPLGRAHTSALASPTESTTQSTIGAQSLKHDVYPPSPYPYSPSTISYSPRPGPSTPSSVTCGSPESLPDSLYYGPPADLYSAACRPPHSFPSPIDTTVSPHYPYRTHPHTHPLKRMAIASCIPSEPAAWTGRPHGIHAHSAYEYHIDYPAASPVYAPPPSGDEPPPRKRLGLSTAESKHGGELRCGRVSGRSPREASSPRPASPPVQRPSPQESRQPGPCREALPKRDAEPSSPPLRSSAALPPAAQPGDMMSPTPDAALKAASAMASLRSARSSSESCMEPEKRSAPSPTTSDSGRPKIISASVSKPPKKRKACEMSMAESDEPTREISEQQQQQRLAELETALTLVTQLTCAVESRSGSRSPESGTPSPTSSPRTPEEDVVRARGKLTPYVTPTSFDAALGDRQQPPPPHSRSPHETTYPSPAMYSPIYGSAPLRSVSYPSSTHHLPSHRVPEAPSRSSRHLPPSFPGRVRAMDPMVGLWSSATYENPKSKPAGGCASPSSTTSPAPSATTPEPRVRRTSSSPTFPPPSTDTNQCTGSGTELTRMRSRGSAGNHCESDSEHGGGSAGAGAGAQSGCQSCGCSCKSRSTDTYLPPPYDECDDAPLAHHYASYGYYYPYLDPFRHPVALRSVYDPRDVYVRVPRYASPHRRGPPMHHPRPSECNSHSYPASPRDADAQPIDRSSVPASPVSSSSATFSPYSGSYGRSLGPCLAPTLRDLHPLPPHSPLLTNCPPREAAASRACKQSSSQSAAAWSRPRSLHHSSSSSTLSQAPPSPRVADASPPTPSFSSQKSTPHPTPSRPSVTPPSPCTASTQPTAPVTPTPPRNEGAEHVAAVPSQGTSPPAAPTPSTCPATTVPSDPTTCTATDPSVFPSAGSTSAGSDGRSGTTTPSSPTTIKPKYTTSLLAPSATIAAAHASSF